MLAFVINEDIRHTGHSYRTGDLLEHAATDPLKAGFQCNYQKESLSTCSGPQAFGIGDHGITPATLFTIALR